ncbi:MAG: tRNA pseudouridine(55) synthase TruB [Gammaproteobacteria bacterium]|nr:tRNA pseudouridine(55) synthase TruB [Gammaproteobacteria bacterium]
MSRKSKGRPVHGVLLLDKPIGMSSNAALQKVKRLYNAQKAGHTGSLDPLATGVLPLCFGEATKVSGFLLDADKRYLCECRLGVTTTTGDAEGEVLLTREVPVLSDVYLQTVLAKFTGTLQQIPPMYSALKRDGVPLYKLARKGETVERAARTIKIYALHLNEWQADRLVLDVSCSKGTYIRSLAEDIGEAIGCGAHLTMLRRIKAGPYEIEQSVTFEQLEQALHRVESIDAYLLPLDGAIQALPAIVLPAELARLMLQGQAVSVTPVPDMKGLVCLRLYRAEVDMNAESTIETAPTFLGIGQILADGRIAPKRLICE